MSFAAHHHRQSKRQGSRTRLRGSSGKMGKVSCLTFDVVPSTDESCSRRDLPFGALPALCPATSCAVRQRTFRRVLEYWPQSTLPHSARPPALEQAKRFRFGDARCLHPAAASLLIARLFQPSMRRKRNRAGLFFRKARLRGSFFTNFARRLPPACTFWEYEPH